MDTKKYFKEDFTVRISTFACIDSYEKAKYWEDMGADYICVDFVKINRDFNVLKYKKNLPIASFFLIIYYLPLPYEQLNQQLYSNNPIRYHTKQQV